MIEHDLRNIPEHMRESLLEYIRIGRPVGSFLRAVLANDFQEAVGRADGSNLRCLEAWAIVMYNYVPMRARGSYNAVDRWIAEKQVERASQKESNDK